MRGLLFATLFFAALLEVGGDAVIRKGLRSAHPFLILLGVLLLGFYGIMVNTVKWDFSKLFGVYVAVFAVVGVLAGRLVFKETVPISTWIGLLTIVVGATIIQVGQR